MEPLADEDVDLDRLEAIRAGGGHDHPHRGRVRLEFVLGGFLLLGFVVLLSACEPLTGIREIAVGGTFTCALHDDGTVTCWGEGEQGQLGDNSTFGSEGPVRVTGITNATTITAGGRHACAVLEGGTVRCWGQNHWGQLGDGSNVDRSTPVPVVGISTATAIDSLG
jgi:hypothetical protein